MTFQIAMAGVPVIYVGSANLTTAGRALSPAIEYDAVDVTAFSDSARRNLLGLHGVTVRYDGLFDGSATTNSPHGALVALLGTTRQIVTVWMMGDGTGTEGVGLGSAYAAMYRPSGAVGEVVSLGADIGQDGRWDRAVSLGSSTSVQLAASATFAGPDIDGLATWTAGGACFIHVFARATGTMSFRLQDSAGGGGTGYTNVTGATATFVGSAGIGISTILTFTTLLQRYRRIHITTLAGGGTGTSSFQASVSER